MTGEREQAIRRRQMASFGRLLADFSHEMCNHLAVIQEANGLLEDILAMEGGEGTPLFAALGEATGQIGQRVRRSAEFCQHLSGMAHRSDTPFSSFSVNELLAELAVFLERSARSRQVALLLELGQEIDPIYNEPALLQHVLYQLYAFSLDLLSNGQTLIISTAQAEAGVVISFRLVGVPELELAGMSETVQAAVVSLGTKLEHMEITGEGAVDSSGFRLLLPSLSVA